MEILAQFANFKLAGDRYVREAVFYFRDLLYGPPNAAGSKASQGGNGSKSSSRRCYFIYGREQPGRRRRRGLGARVGTMSDADLEAELAARRAARVRERNKYERAMRSEKLAALEEELNRLRSEIARIDPAITRRAAGISDERSTQHSHVTWDALPQGDADSSQQLTDDSGPQGKVPPPPPMRGPPPPPGEGDFDLVVDPEKQKREKAERQRRREEKRKQREEAKKPMTLADIIRSAGPDPIKRLKPASAKVSDSDDATAESSFADSLQTMKMALKSRDGDSPDQIQSPAKDVDTAEMSNRDNGDNGVSSTTSAAVASESENSQQEHASRLTDREPTVMNGSKDETSDEKPSSITDSPQRSDEARGDKIFDKADDQNAGTSEHGGFDSVIQNNGDGAVEKNANMPSVSDSKVVSDAFEKPDPSVSPACRQSARPERKEDSYSRSSSPVENGSHAASAAVPTRPKSTGSEAVHSVGEVMAERSNPGEQHSNDTLGNARTEGRILRGDVEEPHHENGIRLSSRSLSRGSGEQGGMQQNDLNRDNVGLPSDSARLSSLSNLVANLPAPSRRSLGADGDSGKPIATSLSSSDSISSRSPSKLTLAEKRKIRNASRRARNNVDAAQRINDDELTADPVTLHKLD